jgi:hypothetical protein
MPPVVVNEKLPVATPVSAFWNATLYCTDAALVGLDVIMVIEVTVSLNTPEGFAGVTGLVFADRLVQKQSMAVNASRYSLPLNPVAENSDFMEGKVVFMRRLVGLAKDKTLNQIFQAY